MKLLKFFCCTFLKGMSKNILTTTSVESFGVKNMIQHNTVKDLLGLTMLVYDYSKKFTLNEDETIESFVNKNENTKNDDINLEITDERKDVLEKLSKTSPHGQVVKFISDKKTDIQVGVTISELNKRISVIFRGSESKSDWYYDLMVLKRQILPNIYNDVWVHSGFYYQLHETDVYSKLVETVKGLKKEYPEYNIYITGHSLGAALSTLFGFELSHEIESDITVISFASPRIGNYGFRKAFDSKDNLVHYRVSNDRDIVTAGPMINFHHVGMNIALDEDKCEFFTKYDYNGWMKFSLFNCWRVSDHNVDLYYTRLCKHTW